MARRVGFWVVLLSLGMAIHGPPTAAAEPADAEAQARAAEGKRRVAILVYNGVELLDFAGPSEVFASAGRSRAFEVFTVAETRDPIASQGFVTVRPQYSIADCPRPDLIVVPGGAPLRSRAVIDWIKRRAPDSELVMSVCTGAFALAEAGLLDGVGATTHWSALDDLQRRSPGTKVQRNVRFVDSGKVVTSAGVSAGIDGALHVVTRLLGTEAARQTARYMEYRWEPEPSDLATASAAKPLERQALERWYLGEWASCAGLYQRYVAEHPDDGIAHYRLGTCLSEARRPGAVAHLKRAIELGQTHGAAWSNLGLAQLVDEKPQEAIQSYEKALALGWRRGRTYYNLGCAYALTSQKAKAIDALARAVDAHFVGRAYLETDSDLVSLRGDPEFQALLQRAN
jgi:putative intracellular protease/amidase